MTHYKYIDVVRRPDGTLRPWEEYDTLSRYEDSISRTDKTISSAVIHYARKIKEIESEKRSRFQGPFSKICNKA